MKYFKLHVIEQHMCWGAPAWEGDIIEQGVSEEAVKANYIERSHDFAGMHIEILSCQEVTFNETRSFYYTEWHKQGIPLTEEQMKYVKT